MKFEDISWDISLDYPGLPECKMRPNDFGSSHQRSGGEREYSQGMLEVRRKSHFHLTDVTKVLSQSVSGFRGEVAV